MNEAMTQFGFYYHPVIERGEAYVEAPASSASAIEPIPAPDLGQYIIRHYTAEVAKVMIGGMVYEAPIFRPVSGDDLLYVLVDDRGIPVDSPDPEEVAASSSDDDYFTRLIERVSHAEAMLPEQGTYLWSQFLEPTFLSRGGGEHTIRSWESIFGEDRLVLLGEAGSGKTSCLRRMALEYAASRRDRERVFKIPVYIQLREWTRESSLMGEVRQVLYRTGGAHFAQSLSQFLQSGRLIILLDGLDEIAQPWREQAEEEIARAAEEFSLLSLVLTTRVPSYRRNLPGFLHLEMEPFSRAQVAEWTCQRLYRRGHWDMFLAQLQSEPVLSAMSGNPLMLSLTVAGFLQNRITPRDRARVVEGYVRALVDEWDSVRGVTRSLEPWAAPFAKLNSLCRVARFATNECYEFSGLEYRVLESGWAGGGPADEMLRVLHEDTSLLVKDSGESWRIKSEGVGNFLTALYLVEGTDDVQVALLSKLGAERWREVWDYACGLSQDATHLLEFVLATPELAEDVRAIMIAGALSQSLSVARDTMERACVFVVDVLQRNFENWMFEVKDAGVDAWLLLVPRQQVVDQAEMRQCRDLTHKVLMLNGAIAGSEVSSRLSSSPLESLRLVGGVLRKEEDQFDAEIVEAAEHVGMVLKRSRIEGSPASGAEGSKR